MGTITATKPTGTEQYFEKLTLEKVSPLLKCSGVMRVEMAGGY